jgi:mRNA interferase RelE/StbE
MPDDYRIDFIPAATRALERLPRDTRQQLLRLIRNLAANPRPPGVRMLQGRDRLYRVRAGSYRVVHEIDDRNRSITIRIISHRRDVYRGL